ncbi:MAG: hypothetical protein QOJ64_1090 [Acidobacteriota bacterium]|jgi:hypothetical protein|nr:hypothetical protein [Acidobacteriota bacterium]
MSSNEVYADDAQSEATSGRRLGMVLLAILLAVCLLGAAAYLIARQRSARSNAVSNQLATAVQPSGEAEPASNTVAKSWKIEGALTEACTCSVPCSCNFGQGPSPHTYCYPFYSYHIRKGNYGDVALDDLHFGSADLRSGRYMFMDARANERQREVLRLIMARVIERASPDEAEAKAKEIGESVRYAAVEQSYDNRKNHLKVEGIGEFSADYVMGLDKESPIVVRNNTTWRIREAIKAKTSSYKVKIGRDVINTKDTNSNQGDYEYTDAMDFGAPVRWNCGADANRMANGSGEQSCQK